MSAVFQRNHNEGAVISADFKRIANGGQQCNVDLRNEAAKRVAWMVIDQSFGFIVVSSKTRLIELSPIAEIESEISPYAGVADLFDLCEIDNFIAASYFPVQK